MKYFELKPIQDKRTIVAAPYPFPDDLISFVLGPSIPGRCVYRAESGTVWPTILGMGAWSSALVSVFDSVGAKGLRTYDIDVLDRAGRPIEGYRGIQVLGRGGSLVDKESNVYRIDRRLWSYDCVIMETDKWDGSDVFAIPELGVMTFVTERVAHAVEHSRLTLISLIPNTECKSVTRPPPSAD
jgi:hypothetical protein